ncbi:MAG TPA: hypothetical protein VF756_02440 [Thermoanaerobaculia bacterium]
MLKLGGFSVLAAACAALALAGCATRRLTVEPAMVSPGMIVRVSSTKPVFRKGEEGEVRIAGRPASIVRTVSEREVDVMVPAVEAGAARVTLGRGGQSTGNVTVLPAPSVELVVSMEDNKLTLMRATPRAGEVETRVSRDQARLSFDVINEQGGLVFTGAVADPTRREVFDGPNSQGAVLRGTPRSKKAVFAVKVPNVPGRFTVKFYAVPAGVDLKSTEGRAAREPLGEIVVERKEKP